jgi:hypothetical protein
MLTLEVRKVGKSLGVVGREDRLRVRLRRLAAPQCEAVKLGGT